jgi:hypothetical protein
MNAFPVGRYWLPAAIVLVLATAAAPLRRLPLARLPVAIVSALALVVLSRELGSFWFLLWPLTAIAVLAMAFGGVAPRLAALAVGGVLVAIPSAVGYVTEQNPVRHGSTLAWAVTAGLAAGLFVPVAHLTRRRLT